MVREAGEAESSKSGAMTTVSVKVVLRLSPPPLPVTVMGYVPGTVTRVTPMVIIEVPEPGGGMVTGLKVTLTPRGTPDAERLMKLLNPPLTVVVIVDMPWLPWAMVRDEGEAEIVKSGWPCEVTVNVTVVVCLIPPPDVPITVMG